MTEEQKAACEKLAIADMRTVSDALVFSPTPPAVVGHSCFIRGFQAAQTPETLMLNPLVEELVEIGRAMLVNQGTEMYMWKNDLLEALAPFKEVKK